MRDIYRYLSAEAFDFDLRRLNDARIIRPERANKLLPLQRSVDLLTASDRELGIHNNSDLLHANARLQRAKDGPWSLALALGPAAIETIRSHPEIAWSYRGVPELCDATYYRYEDDRSYQLTVYDETVILELSDGYGGVPAIIETDDAEVLLWAEEGFNQYKGDTDSLDPDIFALDH